MGLEYDYDYSHGIENTPTDKLAEIEHRNVAVFANIVARSRQDLLSASQGRENLAIAASCETMIDVKRARKIIDKLTVQIRQKASQIKPADLSNSMEAA